jgi:hypothetical protein
MNHKSLKKINLSRKKIQLKKDLKFYDEEFIILNEIIQKSKLETIILKGKGNFNNKDNNITKEGLEILKESIMNHGYLKYIDLSRKIFN